jgi:hypothetical protein
MDTGFVGDCLLNLSNLAMPILYSCTLMAVAMSQVIQASVRPNMCSSPRFSNGTT